MDIALLNIKIIFQKNEVVTNRIGNHKNEWKEFYSCFATVSGEGGIEKNVAGLITQDSDISFTARYCKALSDINSTKRRILFDNEAYNIVSIDYMNYKKRYLKFKCEKERKK